MTQKLGDGAVVMKDARDARAKAIDGLSSEERALRERERAAAEKRFRDNYYTKFEVGGTLMTLLFAAACIAATWFAFDSLGMWWTDNYGVNEFWQAVAGVAFGIVCWFVLPLAVLFAAGLFRDWFWKRAQQRREARRLAERVRVFPTDVAAADNERATIVGVLRVVVPLEEASEYLDACAAFRIRGDVDNIAVDPSP